MSMYRLSVLALVPLFAGCGGQEAGDRQQPPKETIAEASQAMADAASARIRSTSVFEIQTQEGETVEAEISCTGVADYRSGTARVVCDMSELAGPGAKMERIFESPVFYSKLPGGDLPPGTWVKVDPEALAAKGFDASRLSGLSEHPAPVLDYLDAVEDVEEVGEEDVNGVETTQYRGIVARSAGGSTEGEIPVEFWIDDESLVRRMRFQFASTLLGTGNEASTSQTIDLSEFGVMVDIEPPPPGQVVPIETLFEEAEERP
jgi:hypothetical protein